MIPSQKLGPIIIRACLDCKDISKTIMFAITKCLYGLLLQRSRGVTNDRERGLSHKSSVSSGRQVWLPAWGLIHVCSDLLWSTLNHLVLQGRKTSHTLKASAQQ